MCLSLLNKFKVILESVDISFKQICMLSLNNPLNLTLQSHKKSFYSIFASAVAVNMVEKSVY